MASGAGPFARVEAGARIRSNLGVFGFGQVDNAGAMAGVGARWTW